jgi:hypothetical protein
MALAACGSEDDGNDGPGGGVAGAAGQGSTNGQAGSASTAGAAGKPAAAGAGGSEAQGGVGGGNEPLAGAAGAGGEPELTLEERCQKADMDLGITRPAGWAPESHCKFAPADVAKVFPADSVQKLTITMSSQEYAAMQADLDELMGGQPFFAKAFSKKQAAQHIGGGDDDSDPCSNRMAGATCSLGSSSGVCRRTTGPLICEVNGFDQGDVSGVPLEAAAPFWSRDPKYFRAEIDFAGSHFTSVGIRYKGNNGLASSAQDKRPLRLKLDEWETENPAITDQRLFGFQDLSFSPGQTDDSQLHQVLAMEVFRGQGIPAPYATFVEVYLDTGSGAKLIGLYSMTEVPDDQLPERVFGNENGNMYKPDGRGAHFLSFIQESMHKRNNDAAGYEDIEAFVSALHANQSDRAAWRTALRKAFDIDTFAQFYAVNQGIANWDTYGGYAHNFYPYHEKKSDQLMFLPWDCDLAFDGTGGTDLSLASFDGTWPLIQAVARDADFGTHYVDGLRALYDTQLTTGALLARANALSKLIEPAIEREEAVHEGTKARWQSGKGYLDDHIAMQTERVAEFLDALSTQ